ncbi:DUF3954 domain-containing protein [Geomicrobium sediminis]|uniref:DUF3954 domain-containing protein n=1 Tax=Geomicrobium sediminis TaxID=1347788 RepID=A0ABS2PEK8_9BACL|nr:hypothetical protein [Geomicrobium sediminis]
MPETKLETMTAEIDCSVNAMYIVKDGVVKMIPPLSSGYGEQHAVWQNGKIDRVVNKEIIKV